MSYLALYRKWRPTDFDQVKGQDAVVRTLRNQLIYDRIGHAYLFCGTRGTGKTSIAKLFARAVNCENPVDGNPCGICSSCRAIADQTSMDVIEIDAASNNGVENVRQIREQVRYMPTSGRYKIYIIDEVHMLSASAFNALLKTLEEPPSYVIFILATTEKHKVPVTILSRCQQYDFHRISVNTITDHLADLMEKENIRAERKGLAFVARMADGSMRDSLSLLDQCIAFYPDQELTYDRIVDVLGLADMTLYSSLLGAVAQRNTRAILKIIDQVIMEGSEVSQFLNDFLWYLRNLLLIKDGGQSAYSQPAEDGIQEGRDMEREMVLDISTENIEAMRKDAGIITTGELLHMIRTLSELSAEIRYATQKRVVLEVGFIKLCLPDMTSGPEALLARIQRLEENMANQAARPWIGPYPAGQEGQDGSPDRDTISQGRRENKNPSSSGQEASVPEQDPDEALKSRFSQADAEDLRKIASSWNRIVGSMDNPMRRHLRQARIAVADDKDMLLLIFDSTNSLSENAKLYLEKNSQENLELLSEMVARRTGKKTSFRCVMTSPAEKKQANLIDLTKIRFENIEIVDE